MKVILLDNIRGIGRVGDLKDVNDGYARNFLIPRKLARVAGAQAQQEAEAMKARRLEASTLAEAEAERLAAVISQTTLTMHGRANAKGTLFAGIESSHIAEVLSAAVHAHISDRMVLLEEHLKTLGEHTVRIRVGNRETQCVVRIEP
jgi:large subunit ribosomal protein L9